MRLGNDDINDVLWNSLRVGQQKGLQNAFDYLTQDAPTHSCLVSLPTGAGKTGVIATLAHFCSQQNVLVICHRSAVKEQLIKQLSGEFFEERAPEEELVLKPVWNGVNLVADSGVYITTFQKLSSLNSEALGRFTENIDLLIIDEGHSEPSPVWSKISRGIAAHKVIITATPYRNDLFKFDVSPEWSYIYTFHHAIADDVLSEPIFEEVSPELLLGRVKELFEEQPETKCIIKCESRQSIEAYADVFSGHYKTLAIHQQFTGDDRANFKSIVPKKLKNSDYQVIIHQRKLDEGVDIPSAKILVLTYAVNSGRELVQTVGRIVRKSEGHVARVLDLSRDSNAQLWRNFLSFDEYISSPGAVASFLKSLDTSSLLKSYLDSFPEISYFDSGYKRKFDIERFDPALSLNLPLASLCFIRKENDFSLPAFIDATYWKLVAAGELVSIKNCLGFSIIVSVSFDNSKFLSDSLFFEPSLQLVIAREAGDLLVIYDSRGVNYSYEPALKLGGAISLEQILSLAARTQRLKTKSTTSFAIGDAKYRPEGITWRGKNLEDISNSQANASYAISTLLVDNLTAEGKAESSYYLGVASGRISDQKKKNLSLAQLANWIADIHEVIAASARNQSPLLNSFAKPVNEAPAANPSAMLLDLSGFSDPIPFRSGGHDIFISNEPHYLPYDSVDGSFSLPYDGGGVCFSLTYNLKTQLPELQFVEGFSLNCRQIEGDHKNYVAGQSIDEVLSSSVLKIIYQDSVAYLSGSYYKMRVPTDLGVDIEETVIGRSLISVPSLLAQGLEEKGGSANLTGNFFLPCSIFSMIDQMRFVSDTTKTLADLGPFFQHVADLDLLLCTDLGVEPADFIVSSPGKLIYIHVKCGDVANPRSSAGALALVGTQAVKNMEALLSPNEDLFFANWNTLQQPWRTSNDHPDFLKRVRLIDRLAPDEYVQREGLDYARLPHCAWQVLSGRRSSLAVEKEIWIVVGNAFSKRHFNEQIRLGQDCAGETLQAFQLIDSWVNTLSSSEVGLKFFVSE